MKHTLPSPLLRLIEQLSHLPGVGRRTAERMALAMLQWPEESLAAFGQEVLALRRNVRPCRVCGNYAEHETCPICQALDRQQHLLCVVEHAGQIGVIENSGSYRGVYHVLGGRLSPLNGQGPEDLSLPRLRERLESGAIREMIIATSPDLEGEATAHFLAHEFASLPLLITRIASGLPAGSDLSYTDAATMTLALGGRRRFNSADPAEPPPAP